MENSTNILSPDVYLNHLSPEKAIHFEIARNLYMAIVGTAIWDVLVYIIVDIKIVLNGLSAVTFCFIFSRILAITYALVFIVMQTHTVTHCQAMSAAMDISCILSMGCASFLFLRRLHAVYAQNRIVRWIFTFLWAGVTICGIPTFVGVHMGHLSGTNFCAAYKIEKYVSIIDFFHAAFDTLVFFAISYRFITGNSGAFDEPQNWRDAVRGKALPRLSRAVLQSGQQYYLIVFGVAIVTGTILFTPGFTATTYRPLMTLTSTALTASMACRVFRNLKTFEIDHQTSVLPTMSSIGFIPSPVSGEKGEKGVDNISVNSGPTRS